MRRKGLHGVGQGASAGAQGGTVRWWRGVAASAAGLCPPGKAQALWQKRSWAPGGGGVPSPSPPDKHPEFKYQREALQREDAIKTSEN